MTDQDRYEEARLEAFRVAAWERVKEERDRRSHGGCETPLGRVDTDPTAKLNVSGAVVSAMLAIQFGQPFEIDWTMSDNSRKRHDAPAMILMGQTVSRHIARCHAAAAELRVWICDEARTANELQGLDPASALADLSEQGPSA